MNKGLIENYLYNILYQFVKIILPFIVVPYTMYHLGEDTLGISTFAGNIATWFILFGVLGINIYGNREIAKVRDDKMCLSRTFYEILTIRIITVLFSCIFYIFYIKIFVQANQIIYYLYIITIIASAFEITWFYYGVENFKAASLRNIIVKAIGVICIFIFVKEQNDLWKIVLINGLSELLGLFIMYIQLKDYIVWVKYSVKKAFRKHMKQNIILFVPTIAISVYTLLDQTMLGFITNDMGAVAMYAVGQNMVKIFLYFITSIGTIMLPRITNVYHHDNGKEMVQYYISITYKLALLLAIPMMVGMIGISPFFIPWYLPNQPEVALIIQLSSPIVLFIALSNVFGNQYMLLTGMNKKYSQTVLIGALVNFLVNLLLIPKYSYIGAVIGSVVAELSVTLSQYVLIRKEIDIKCKKSIMKYTSSSILMYFLAIWIGSKMQYHITTNIVQIALGIMVYIVLLIIQKEKVVIEILEKLIGKSCIR